MVQNSPKVTKKVLVFRKVVRSCSLTKKLLKILKVAKKLPSRIRKGLPGEWLWRRSYMWVELLIHWFSPLLREVFLRVLRFSLFLKNRHFQISIRSGTHEHVSTRLLSTSWVNNSYNYKVHTFIGRVRLTVLQNEKNGINARNHLF